MTSPMSDLTGTLEEEQADSSLVLGGGLPNIYVGGFLLVASTKSLNSCNMCVKTRFVLSCSAYEDAPTGGA
ncbi:hypothetical protein C8A06_0167 [Microbacteriaceae bacterium MWH-Ta3]|nr:hypothetical protein C8A06_0167 [Microbacteriaceae bacterium MWH-Ta3]